MNKHLGADYGGALQLQSDERVRFMRQIANARPGERIVYHTGDLARDCRSHNTDKADGVGEKHILRGRRDAAMRAAERGFATLFQKRVEPGVYEYYLVRIGDGSESDMLKRFKRRAEAA